MKTFQQLRETTAKVAVITFGRFNPPTIGHELMINKLVSTAKRYGGDAYVFASGSQDAKKNPFPYDEKIALMKKMFPVRGHNIFRYASVKPPTVMHAASAVFADGYQELVLVVGSDRVGQFKKLLPQYNGVKGKAHGEYEFSKIEVVSAGERDPDADDATGMSASKLRALAVDGDYDNFQNGLPDTLSSDQKRKVYQSLRRHMRLKVIEKVIHKNVEVKEEPKKEKRSLTHLSAIVDYLKELPTMRHEQVYIDKVESIIESLDHTEDYFFAKAQIREAKKYIDILDEGSGMVDFEICDYALFDQYLDLFEKKEYELKPLRSIVQIQEGDFEKAALALGIGLASQQAWKKWLQPMIKAKFSIKEKIKQTQDKIDKLKDKAKSLDSPEAREKITDQVAKLEDEISAMRQKVKSINADIEKKKKRKSGDGKGGEDEGDRKTGDERAQDARMAAVANEQEKIDRNQDKIDAANEQIKKFEAYGKDDEAAQKKVRQFQDAKAALVDANKKLRAKIISTKKRAEAGKKED